MASRKEFHRHAELTFVGRTYMIFLYLVSTLFLLLVLGGVLNGVSEKPDRMTNLWLALGMWICFIAGGIIYEYHRESFRRIGLRRRSLSILLPMIFLAVIGFPIILVSELPYHPVVRVVFSVLVIFAGFLLWRSTSTIIKDKLRVFREREF